MKIRKMEIFDLVFINDNFNLGKGMNIRATISDYVYVAENEKEISGFLYADATKSGTAVLFAIEVLDKYRKKRNCKAIDGKI